MLDAFIIDQNKQAQKKSEWQPTPLTLELPIPENKEAEEGKDQKKKEEQLTIRF